MGCGASTPDKTTKAPAAAQPTPAAAKSVPPAPPTSPTTPQAPATVELAVTVDLKVNSEGGVSAVVMETPTKAAPPAAAAVEAAPVAPATAAAAAGGGGDSCVLRVICVNDVYEMDHMPRLKTAIKELRMDNTVVLLAGDFLAPSLLSSLDSGMGMVDVMNDVGVEYVCFGNHEQDVAHKDMLKRIKESKFKWINSNAPSMPLDGVDCPAHCGVTATGGGQSRRVEILGLNTGDPGLYTAAAWGGAGAACIEPIVPCAKTW